jgi:hypothetical protein
MSIYIASKHRDPERKESLILKKAKKEDVEIAGLPSVLDNF